jgi:deoxyribonuclease V
MSNDLKRNENVQDNIIDLERLRSIQRSICKRIEIIDFQDKDIEFVSGIDVAYLDKDAIIGIARFNFQNKKLIECIIEIERVNFPYMPGFLGFREGALIIKVLKRIKIDSDIYMINAHGIAHPEGCGCASHIGVLIKKATIGIASKILCGSYRIEPTKVGDWLHLIYKDKKVGAVLKSKENCKPIIISVGNMITLERSVSVVKEFLKDNKFPEPLRVAHEISINKRREIRKS